MNYFDTSISIHVSPNPQNYLEELYSHCLQQESQDESQEEPYQALMRDAETPKLHRNTRESEGLPSYNIYPLDVHNCTQLQLRNCDLSSSSVLGMSWKGAIQTVKKLHT